MPDSTAQRPWAKDLAEAREVAARLRASLPSQIEVAALGVRSRATSIKETTAHFAFHVQMLADFLTVEELGHKMLLELSRA
jgi:hypothetical protein